jgi:hypothetical protein
MLKYFVFVLPAIGSRTDRDHAWSSEDAYKNDRSKKIRIYRNTLKMNEVFFMQLEPQNMTLTLPIFTKLPILYQESFLGVKTAGA